jgi:hypothetical protein
MIWSPRPDPVLTVRSVGSGTVPVELFVPRRMLSSNIAK